MDLEICFLLWACSVLTDFVDEHAGARGVDASPAALVGAGLADEDASVGHDTASETLVQQHVAPLRVRVHDVTLVPRAQATVLALCGDRETDCGQCEL